MTATSALDPTPGISSSEQATRQHWIGVLARSQRAELLHHEPALRDVEYQLIRTPEIGMTLVRGRMGGSGAPFNVGEMTVTRCVVRLADGRTGYSYLAGRDKAHAELAALADAHLQGTQQAHWIRELIEPLAQAQAVRRCQHQAEVAATKVDFFTLVRGEN